MLIPPRRVGESLKIGNDIQVTVLGVRGNQIRMGIYAPADVPVHREEIYDRIHEEVDPEIDGPGSGSNPDTAQ